MTQLDKNALKEAKSLGEKLAIASANDAGLSAAWGTCRDDVKAEFERIALAFAASLTHDESANATITALRASLEEAEAENRRKQNALNAWCRAWDAEAPTVREHARDLMFRLKEATTRAEAAERREARLREALKIAETWARHAIDHAIHHEPPAAASLARDDQGAIRAALSEEA